MTERIETPRLILRKARESDLDAIWHNVWEDGSLAEYTCWTPFTATREEAEDRLRRTIAFQAQVPMYFICLRDTDEAIGFVGAHEEEPGEYYGIGLCVAAAHQRKGYGAEAYLALMKEFFFRGSAERWIYSCFRENQPSAMLCASLGFTFLRSSERVRERDGRPYICDEYLMMREQFLARYGANA